MKNLNVADFLENLGFGLIILGIIFMVIKIEDFIIYLLFAAGVILTYASRIVRVKRQ